MLFAQDYSNKGKDFWIIYTGHIDATSSRMALYITSDQNATGTLTVGGSSLNFSVTANQITTLRLTNSSTPNNSLAYNSQVTGIGVNKGIHIVTDKDIVVYAHILNAARSGSTLVLPTKVLGREYFVSSYASVGGNNSKSEFAVVATQDNTTIEINPKLADANNTYPANVPFQITLNKGDVFQYQSANSVDLSGTYIKSIAVAGSPCKPIAVFAGSTWTAMGCATAGSGDNLYQQLFPLVSWGQLYITAPFKLRSYDIFRVMVKDPTTVVQVNGVVLNPATLINGAFYEFNTNGNNTPRVITADKPVSVAQYMITQSCDGVNSDPEMIFLSPIEQTLTDITVLSARNDLTPPNTNISRHFLNIIIKTAGLSGLRIDGALYTSTPVAIPTTNYSYLQEEVTNSTLSNPSHRIIADSGFAAIAYGYGNVESYGYNAGTNVRDLYQFVSVQNQYATVPFPAACKTSPFFFSMVFPYQPTQIIWNFNGLFSNVTINNPVYDSTWVVNGRNLYRYKLLTPYAINTVGTYPIKVTAQNPTPDGCGSEQEINYDLQVFEHPDADFTYNPVCFPDPVQFTDNSNTNGRPVISRFWDFGDVSYSSANNPSHTYGAPGPYDVKYALITDVGCLSDTISHPVTIHPLPTASIAGDIAVCQNASPPDITFTGAVGTAPYTFTYNINGGANQTVTTSSGNSVTVSVPTNIPGIYTYNLVSVQDASPATCQQNQTGSVIVNVRQLPTAVISGTTDVCINEPAPVITFTGATGTAPYTFTYNINGGPTQTISTTSGNSVTINAPTNIAGTFIYNLLSVQESSSLVCGQLQNGNTIVIIKPDATINLNTANNIQSLCINTPISNIDYVIGGGGTGGTVTGLPPGVTGIYNAGVLTISGSPNAVGTYNYTVNTTGTCIQKSLTGTITVNPDASLVLSSAPATTNQSLCINTAIVDITYSIGGGGTNGVITGLPPGVNGIYNNGIFTISGSPSVIGIYTYTLTTTGTCIQKTLAGTITVNPDATINLSTANNIQSLCINTPINNIDYAIGGGGTGGTVTGLPPGVTGIYNAGIFTISGSPNAVGTYNYTVNTTGTCIQKSLTGTITVNPDASLVLSSAPATTNQSLCINTAIVDITYSIGGGGTNGVITGLPPGVNGIYNNGVFTISGSPSVIGTYSYTLTTTGTCIQKTLTGTITVNPDAAIVLSSLPATAAQELCRNSTITNITYTISGGGTGGTVSGLPAGITGTYNAGIFTITGAPTEDGTFNYTVNTTGTCVQKDLSGSIIVNPLPTGNFNITSPTTCAEGVINFNDLSIPHVGTLSTWQWNFGDPSSGAANTSILQNPTHVFNSQGTYNVSLSVTNTKGCVSDPVYNSNVVINPKPSAGYIVPDVCLSDTYAQFYDTTHVSNPDNINNWQWNFGDPVSGANNNSLLQNPQHSYSATGLYIVELVVTSNKGCKDTIEHQLQVNGSYPVANFNLLRPANLCANDSIAIEETSTVFPGAITKVEIYWDNIGQPTVFDRDDFPITGRIYKHKFPDFQTPATRTYQIRYRAYSGGVCLHEKIQDITINASPKVQFDAMPDICLDAAPYLINQGSEIGGVPGTWAYSGPGVNAGGLFNPSITGPGTFDIKYTFTSTAAGCRDSLTKPIIVIDSASAKFTYSILTCEKTAMSFNSTTSTIPPASGTITGWSWDFGDPGSGVLNTSTLQNPTHLFTGWGTYLVKLYVTTSNNCRSTVKTIPVYVNPIPRPDFSTPPSSCLPSASVVFTNTSDIPDGTKSALTYLWDFGDPSSGILNNSSGTSPTHIYNSTGPFNVNLKVTSGVGCFNDTTILLTTVHPQPLATFSIDNKEVCVGSSFKFTDNTNPMDGFTNQWNWSMGDGYSRTLPVFNYIYGSPGTYNISLYTFNNHGCRSTTAYDSVTVHPYPVVDAGPDRLVLEGGQIILDPIVSGNDLSFLWTPNMYFGGTNTILKPTVNGVDDITYLLTVTARGNCSDTSSVFIKVLKFPSIPNIFSPNGDGVNDKWIIQYIETYPDNTVEIFNRYGQRIFSSVGYGTPWDGTVNGKPVPIGTYYFIVNPKNGRKIMSGYVDVIR